MAAPVVAETTFSQYTTAADPWTNFNLPVALGDFAAGQLLIVYTRTAGAQTIATITGFTLLVDDDSSDASDDNTCIGYRWTDGTETTPLGTSPDLSAAAKGAMIGYRITGAINPSTQPPEITAATTSAGANIDPPSITPTGGSKDYLVLVFGGCDGETQTFTAPATYNNDVGATVNSGTGGAAATNCRIAMASLAVTSATPNPGAWTVAAPATGASTWTMAVHPPAAASGSLVYQPGLQRAIPRSLYVR